MVVDALSNLLHKDPNQQFEAKNLFNEHQRYILRKQRAKQHSINIERRGAKLPLDLGETHSKYFVMMLPIVVFFASCAFLNLIELVFFMTNRKCYELSKDKALFDLHKTCLEGHSQSFSASGIDTFGYMFGFLLQLAQSGVEPSRVIRTCAETYPEVLSREAAHMKCGSIANCSLPDFAFSNAIKAARLSQEISRSADIASCLAVSNFS